MSDSLGLPASLANDQRSQIVASLSQRLYDLDRSRVLVYLIDQVDTAVLPYLAEQFNLAGLLWNHVSDAAGQRRLLKQAVAWHRSKGTPAALTQLFAAWGYRVVVEDLTSSAQRWTEYQLAFERALSGSESSLMRELARLVAPRRAHLVRLFNAYDLRPIGLSQAAALDHGLLSDDSGTLVDGIKQSFAVRLSYGIDVSRTLQIHTSRSDVLVERVWYDGSTRLDVWRLDSQIVVNHKIIAGQLMTLSTQEGLSARQLIGRHRNLARCAIVLSDDDEALGHENARFGGAAHIVKKAFVLDQTRLSDDAPRSEPVDLDDMQQVFSVLGTYRSITHPVAPGVQAQFGFASLWATHLRRVAGNWQGTWNHHTWWSTQFAITLSHQGA